MTPTAIMAICILGCDVAIYIFFKRLYGEKQGRRVRRPITKDGTLRARNHRSVRLAESEL
jgi:hypothetical protein